MTPVIASLDTTFGQFAADFLLVALIAVNTYMGWRFGLMRRVLAFGGIYLACLAATNVGNAVASAVHPGSIDANAWAFIAVFVVVIAGVEVLGFLFHDLLQRVAVMLFDRITGTILGIATGLAEVLVLFLVAYAVAAAPAVTNATRSDRAQAADAIQSATIAGLAVHITPQLHTVLSPVLPTNLAAHLSLGATKVVTPPV